MKKFSYKEAQMMIPIRSAKAHKNMGGKTLFIAGSPKMPGAAILSATAAYRVGSGYVYLLKTSKDFISNNFPDFLILEKKQLKTNISLFDSIAIGPGLGNTLEVNKILKLLLRSKFPNVLVDADGLNALAQITKPNIPETWILTPHEGEMARLLKKTPKQIHKNRKKYLLEAQKKFGCHILLKGKGTLIANKKTIRQIQTGNKALSKAGTGDVLTGIIAGFLAQGLTPLNAACLGATLHGKIADLWIKKNDYLSLIASDLLNEIPKQLKKMRTLKV
jgi:NAD(P)H-hydrate epimerase